MTDTATYRDVPQWLSSTSSFPGSPSRCAVKNVTTSQPYFKCRLLISSVQATPSRVTRAWHPTRTTATDRAPLPAPSTPTPVPPLQDRVSRTLDLNGKISPGDVRSYRSDRKLWHESIHDNTEFLSSDCQPAFSLEVCVWKQTHTNTQRRRRLKMSLPVSLRWHKHSVGLWGMTFEVWAFFTHVKILLLYGAGLVLQLCAA